MRYANSVGDFGGLTSYDAHFFFYGFLMRFMPFFSKICENFCEFLGVALREIG